jgi:hypothetical protein
MAPAICRTCRVQGCGDVATGLFGEMVEYRRNVAGGGVDRGGVVGHGKSGSAGRGDAAWRGFTGGGGRDRTGELGKNSSSR